MVKVARFRLICQQMDEAENEIDYKEIYRILWELQKQTRTIKNKCIQVCWDFTNRSLENHEVYGTYLNEKEEYGMTLRGRLNHLLGKGSFLYSGNASATTDKAYAEFNAAKKDMLAGNRSILSYKKNQPLELHNKTIFLALENGTYYADLKLLSRPGAKTLGYHRTGIRFKLEVRDNSQRTILDRCMEKTYKVTASKLVYDERSHRWCLNLGYEFTPTAADGLEPDRILGVDLGIHYPICASVYGEWPRFTVDGGEIDEFRRRVEARKRSLQHQGKYCGDGRVGHGRATRCKPVEDIADKIARFRNTCNHKYSKALIDYAVKHHCGTIQMEDLSGITDNADRFLKNWSYYDLQAKIEYKAQAAGIRILKVAPAHTSQRCSKCGCIARENRPSQKDFKCIQCGFQANADYNASQNLAIAKIDKIIQKNKMRTLSTPVFP